ncbi:hypothetical protein [Embleya scabrispora]|uniref:hypothetical protein n=1 Tax=Embleya scabrispora TaxID=159449 RepID=UPI000372ECC9|nr:hypothetical protein [Embleya scabrispora]MYS83194.1 hypothetical protein [Streptomyces sp. SID5474]
MITIISFAVGLIALVVAITITVGRRTSTTSHDGLLIEQDRTGRAESSGGVFGVHANHASFPGVEENTGYFG